MSKTNASLEQVHHADTASPADAASPPAHTTLPEDPGARALSVPDAALVVRRHETTLRRYLRAKRFPNAFRDDEGAWRIPVSDLGGGLLPPPSDTDPPVLMSAIEAELECQLTENAELRHRLAVAETLAAERADRIRELQLSLERLQSIVPPSAPARTPDPDPRPFVWSGEIALQDG